MKLPDWASLLLASLFIILAALLIEAQTRVSPDQIRDYPVSTLQITQVPGQPDQFYISGPVGRIGPFTKLSPIPPAQARVPGVPNWQIPCALGQWTHTGTHLYLCLDAPATSDFRWRRVPLEKEW